LLCPDQLAVATEGAKTYAGINEAYNGVCCAPSRRHGISMRRRQCRQGQARPELAIWKHNLAVYGTHQLRPHWCSGSTVASCDAVWQREHERFDLLRGSPLPSLGKVLMDQTHMANTTAEELDCLIEESYAQRLY
jgi:hypothetical protein